MLLTFIAAMAFASTLAGGLLALKLRDQLHVILGFSAGAVVGVAFFDLIPESIAVGSPARAPAALLAWTALGFLCYLVLDRIAGLQGPTGRRAGFAASILCLHSLVDGIAIGLGFQTSTSVGLVVAIAVLTHDFSDGINTMNLVLRHNGPRRRGLGWLLLDAAAPVVGIAATRFFALSPAGFGIALALFAGFFLYIGASDLVPESYHAHPKFLTTATTILGAAVLYLAVRLAG